MRSVRQKEGNRYLYDSKNGYLKVSWLLETDGLRSKVSAEGGFFFLEKDPACLGI